MGVVVLEGVLMERLEGPCLGTRRHAAECESTSRNLFTGPGSVTPFVAVTTVCAPPVASHAMTTSAKEQPNA